MSSHLKIVIFRGYGISFLLTLFLLHHPTLSSVPTFQSTFLHRFDVAQTEMENLFWELTYLTIYPNYLVQVIQPIIQGVKAE